MEGVSCGCQVAVFRLGGLETRREALQGRIQSDKGGISRLNDGAQGGPRGEIRRHGELSLFEFLPSGSEKRPPIAPNPRAMHRAGRVPTRFRKASQPPVPPTQSQGQSASQANVPCPQIQRARRAARPADLPGRNQPCPHQGIPDPMKVRLLAFGLLHCIFPVRSSPIPTTQSRRQGEGKIFWPRKRKCCQGEGRGKFNRGLRGFSGWGKAPSLSATSA